MQGLGHQGAPQGKKGGFANLKKSSCELQEQSFDISHVASLGHIQVCSNHDPGVINGATPRGQSLTYAYMSI